MSAPRVTVLMSVFNGERYLREAIESVLGQTFTDFEFLIINDGSIDNSASIIKSYADSRIRLVNNDSTVGLTVSLNKGFELARGEFLARMDADDISRPERLMRQVQFMEVHPQVGVCGSWVQFFPLAKKGVWKLPVQSEEIRVWQFHTVGVAHPSVMIRRQFFLGHGLLYDPRCRYSQDYELWGRAIRYMDFANIPEVLLDYRIGAEQICAVHGAEQRAIMAPLRLQRVRELGIEPTPDEQLLHEMVMNGAVPPEAEYLDKAEKWMMKLGAANRTTAVYATDCFSRRLLDIWFSTCVSLANDSACTLGRCLRSPLWPDVNYSIWLRVRALCAWMLR